MKNKFSLYVFIFVSVILLAYRYYYYSIKDKNEFKITTWDAFGYYLYNPSIIIYKDFKQLDWLDSIDQKYKLSGGTQYQVIRDKKSGNAVFKYLGGVSIIQLPWFLLAHQIAGLLKYPQDGFSQPYQIILAFGMVLWGIFGLWVLRKVLLQYFNDHIVAWSILLLVMATNIIQYFSIDSAMSHVAIFPLYSLQLYYTMRWHQNPQIKYAIAIGFIIGLATICRPTELVMLFIPLLWNLNTKENSIQKWKLVSTHFNQLFVLIASAYIGILPQLIYWKLTAGTWIYDVGSKWKFANPYFRVIFGVTNGWIVYTPICILFLLGLFFVKKFEFKKSVIWFGLLNIWIVIAWFDWRYGATYSTRALVQSLPIYTLAMASILKIIFDTKLKYIIKAIGLFLIIINHFQLWQYNKNILHYRDMNWKYYKEIYLNPNPSPEQYSLLDVQDYIHEESKKKNEIMSVDSTITIDSQNEIEIVKIPLSSIEKTSRAIKISAVINTKSGFFDSYLLAECKSSNSVKKNEIRLARPMSSSNIDISYSFYILPDHIDGELIIKLRSTQNYKGEIRSLLIESIE